MDFTGGILKWAIMINYSTNSDIRDVSKPNGTAHGDFRVETNLLSQTICEKKK